MLESTIKARGKTEGKDRMSGAKFILRFEIKTAK